MKSEIFLISQPHGQADFERFTSKPDVVINQVNTTAHGQEVKATVYYETLESLVDRERVKLMAHSRIADECSASDEYNMMPTQKARERWLIAEWGICAADAKEVTALLHDKWVDTRSPPNGSDTKLPTNRADMRSPSKGSDITLSGETLD